LVVLVTVQLSVLGLYLPPVLKTVGPLKPPQTIISLPVHTAVWEARAASAGVLVAIHVSSVHVPDGFELPDGPPITGSA
jgi:hypothetical protein